MNKICLATVIQTFSFCLELETCLVCSKCVPSDPNMPECDLLLGPFWRDTSWQQVEHTEQAVKRQTAPEFHVLGRNEIQATLALVQHAGQSDWDDEDLVLLPKSIKSSDYQQEMHSMPAKIRWKSKCRPIRCVVLH